MLFKGQFSAITSDWTYSKRNGKDVCFLATELYKFFDMGTEKISPRALELGNVPITEEAAPSDFQCYAAASKILQRALPGFSKFPASDALALFSLPDRTGQQSQIQEE